MSDFTNAFSRVSKINSRARLSRHRVIGAHIAASVSWRACITAISSGSRILSRRALWFASFDKSGAHLSGFTRILAPGAGRGPFNNKLSHFVSGTRASGRGLRGWRVACMFQGHRSSGSGRQRRGGQKERGDAGEIGPGSESARKKESGAPN